MQTPVVSNGVLSILLVYPGSVQYIPRQLHHCGRYCHKNLVVALLVNCSNIYRTACNDWTRVEYLTSFSPQNVISPCCQRSMCNHSAFKNPNICVFFFYIFAWFRFLYFTFNTFTQTRKCDILTSHSCQNQCVSFQEKCWNDYFTPGWCCDWSRQCSHVAAVTISHVTNGIGPHHVHSQVDQVWLGGALWLGRFVPKVVAGCLDGIEANPLPHL